MYEGNMKVTGIFPIPVADIQLKNIDYSVLNYVKQLKFEMVNDNSCEYSVEKRIHDDPFFFELFKNIRKISNIYASEVLSIDLTSTDFHLDIKNSWVIKMKPGDFARSHFHSHSIFSGIFYLNVDNNESNKLIFENSFKVKPFVELPVRQYNQYNCSSFYFVPTQHNLILFPSQINHLADENTSKDTLYSIVFDVSLKGTLCKNTPSEITIG